MTALLLLFVATSQTMAEDGPVSCGIAASYLLLDRLGEPTAIDNILAASPAGANEAMSLAQLQTLFRRLGYSAEGYEVKPQDLRGPVIAYQQRGARGHFVVVEPSGMRFLVLDSSAPPARVTPDSLNRMWDGRVLVVSPRHAPENAHTGWRQGSAEAGHSLGAFGICLGVAGLAACVFVGRRLSRPARG